MHKGQPQGSPRFLIFCPSIKAFRDAATPIPFCAVIMAAFSLSPCHPAHLIAVRALLRFINSSLYGKFRCEFTPGFADTDNGEAVDPFTKIF
jgi:hypothetical protein